MHNIEKTGDNPIFHEGKKRMNTQGEAFGKAEIHILYLDFCN
jgi:hypothetical protein